MGFFDEDTGEMLEIYLLETNQLLDQSDAILLSAEQEMVFSKESINGIFRVMHTIKSSSAMMGLSGLSTLTHRLEDLFVVFREDPSRLSGYEQETFDLIFEATDFIREELKRMKFESFEPEPVDRFWDKIEVLVQKVKEKKKITVRLKFEKDCRMENVRAYMAVRQIRDLCADLKTYPENVETDSSTTEYIHDNGFYISFTSEDPGAVLQTLKSALFVESCTELAEMPNLSGMAEGQAAEGQTAKEPETEAETPVQNGTDFINVRVEKLDELQNLTGELIIAASSWLEASKGSGEDGRNHQVGRFLKELEELVTSIRMVPFSNVVPQLGRIVRDICKKEKKEVSFHVQGQNVEVDKKIADGILDPLLHLIRNAIDHGIEQPEEREKAGKPRAGSVTLLFANVGGEIVVSVSDDGCGIDLEQVRKKGREKNLFVRPETEYSESEILEFCLLPGFSTREAANEYSGRGVGLDVVRQMVEAFGGHLHLESTRGEGSNFIMHLPLTLTIIESIRFQTGDRFFAVPAHQVVQFVTYQPQGPGMVMQEGREFWIRDGRYIPVISLRKFYHIPGTSRSGSEIMAYIKGSTRELCIVADRVTDQGSLVEKSLPAILGKHFKKYTGISGCSLLGDGTICLQLDIEDLARNTGGGKTHE